MAFTATRRTVAALTATLLTLGGAATTASAAPPPTTPGRPTTHPERQPDFDARTPPTRTASSRARPAAFTTLRTELGTQGIIDIDPATATARRIARLDGFLTGPSHRPARRIATDYLTAHPDAFGLNPTEVAALRLRRDYIDVDGTHHLSFQQHVGDIPVFGNGVRADITADGRLIQITGSPAAALPSSLGSAALTAGQARQAAARDTRTTARADDPVTPVAFTTTGGTRLAWQTLSTTGGYLHIIDATTGRVLYRQNLTHDDNGPTATVWQNYPGAARGGIQQTRSLSRWITPDATTLTGNSAHVFLDLDDDDTAGPGEEVTPDRPGDWNFSFTDFTSQVGAPCSAARQCSWDPKTPYSWRTNARQNGAQVFYSVSSFHDHLQAAPIGFTRAAGNFDTADGDPIEVNALDGADTADGLPDFAHADNANMTTPPDGTPARMQMYLFHLPDWPDDPFLAANSGDQADIVYHEYTHGLSNRLVVDAAGNSTLTGMQGYAMGEAWSDWYAFDHMVAQGVQEDTAAPGEILVGGYVSAGQNLIRTQPLDCPVATTNPACPGTPEVGPGGYTYGDFGRILGFAEPHADGEIWGETLWDLRTALGTTLAESLITRAMELSPANPSFLDMRNSILMADRVSRAGRDQKKIWKVFAARGMGWFAAALDGADTTPIEDFSTPPTGATARATLTGTVTDKLTGTPLAGATVGFAGHNSGFADSYQAVTDTHGRYTITGILAGGTYPEVNANSRGYEPDIRDLRLRPGVNQADWSLRRDWAATAGGSQVTEADGVDYSIIGCGPTAALDLRRSTGWSTDAGYDTDGNMDPRHVVVKLPTAVDITAVAIDPTGTCGDDPSSSTGDYRLETSTDATTWTTAAQGHFSTANRSRMNEIPLAPAGTAGVRYLRYTMLSAQVTDEGGSCTDPNSFYTGCIWVDTVEIGVYGTPH